jgi:hypothetical protein
MQDETKQGPTYPSNPIVHEILDLIGSTLKRNSLSHRYLTSGVNLIRVINVVWIVSWRLGVGWSCIRANRLNAFCKLELLIVRQPVPF